MKIEFANTLRGLAALCVLISHLFGVFWFARDTIASFINGPVLTVGEFPTPAFIELLWPVANFSWGLYGVAVFFLISGFVIPFSLAKMSFGGFCASRFVRIVPTYVVGFTITMLAIYWSTYYLIRLGTTAIGILPFTIFRACGICWERGASTESSGRSRLR
jgi:peptidoglycan/LPS O-acetylase OafA/YrhL